MRKASKIAALILAAGYSSRAPGFKPLLPLGNSTVIEKTINSFRRAGIQNIMVVVGHRANELVPVLDELGVRHVFNEQYPDGMFSSVVAGVRSLRPEVEAFFLLPADTPMVSWHTVKLLGRAYKKTGADVVYPVFQGRRGHPPLISTRLAPAVLTWGGPGGLRLLLEQYEPMAYEAEVMDEGVLLDIDTPADYHEIVERSNCRDIPTRNECAAILAKLNVPDIVQRHGRLVANVAWQLADRLNRAGFKLDVRIVVAAGLLHDLAKGRPDHARFGARVLRGLGYPKVAEIVATHTDIAFEEGISLSEAAVVYLADKLVKNDRIVSINERFQCSLEKFAADADALSAINKRLTRAQTIKERVEQALGLDLTKIIADESPIIQVAER
jgi:molybdenum cofactor cytidylyltransferase